MHLKARNMCQPCCITDGNMEKSFGGYSVVYWGQRPTNTLHCAIGCVGNTDLKSSNPIILFSCRSFLLKAMLRWELVGLIESQYTWQQPLLLVEEKTGKLRSISSTLNARILRTKVLFSSFFYLHVTVKKTFIQKMRE